MSSVVRPRVAGVLAMLVFYAALASLAARHSFDDGPDGDPSTDVVGLGATTGDSTTGGGTTGASTTGGGTSGTATPGGEPGEVGSTGGGAATAGATRSAGGAAAPTGTAATSGPRGARTTAAGAGPIRIGIHDDDPGAAFSQFGVEGGPSGNQQEWVARIVTWINANGGMGGRRVEIVPHVTSSLNGSFDQQAQEACTHFTEDEDVDLVVGGARVPSLNLVACLAAHRTPLVWSYQYMADRATFDRYADYLYMPPMVAAERLGVWIDAIARRGFFDGNVRVGVVRPDDAISRRFVEAVIRPKLAARGIQFDDAAMKTATSAASAADVSAQANNTVLRFRSRGVNRVIFVPAAAVLPLLFLRAAQTQDYHPRYTLSTYDNPAFQSDNIGPEQLSGAMAFGWTPAGDVRWEQQPPLSGPAKRCVDLTAAAEPKGNGSVRRFCDGLMFLKFLMDRGASSAPAGLRQAVEGLGTSYESAWTFATRFGPGRHDGASVGRVVLYDDGCSCFRYDGPDIAIP